jgi:hypothetical protein
MTQSNKFPGEWRKHGPTIEEHAPSAELVWVVRGHPFTRPVIARSSVSARLFRVPPRSSYVADFIYIQLMAEGFHDVNASQYPFLKDLEWLGPLELPK